MKDIWKLIEKTDTCWLWKGCISSLGYGKYNQTLAHRMVWEIVKGKSLDPNVDLHHRSTCPKRCVNPDHLEELSRSRHSRLEEHLRRRTHCQRGHELTEENTYTNIRSNGAISRHCKICTRLRYAHRNP